MLCSALFMAVALKVNRYTSRVTTLSFLVCFNDVKECLCDTPGAHLHLHALAHALAHALMHDQNVQFLRLGQFLSNYKG